MGVTRVVFEVQRHCEWLFLHEYKEKLTQVEGDLQRKKEKLETIVEDVAPKTIDKKLLHTFGIVQENNGFL